MRKPIVFLLLCVLSFSAHVLIDHFQVASDSLLVNPHFSNELAGWQVETDGPATRVRAENGILKLSSTSPEGVVQVLQQVELPGGRVYLRIRARMRAENIVGNGRRWSSGRLLLMGPRLEDRYSFYYLAAALSGTTDWLPVDQVVNLSAGAVQVRIQLPRCSGTLLVRDLQLHRVEERIPYRRARLLMTSLWGLFLVWLFVPVLRAGGDKVFVAGCVLLACIMLGTAMPGEIKRALVAWLTWLAGGIVPPLMELLHRPGMETPFGRLYVDMTKIAHFVLFGLLTWLLLRQENGRPPVVRLGDVLMLACATELVQLFIEGRSPLWGDIAIDLSGGVVALGVFFLLRKRRGA